jgi:hypothetical protein
MKAQRRLGLALSWPRITSAFLTDVAVLILGQSRARHTADRRVEPKAVVLDIRDGSIRELVEELGRRMDAYGLRLSRSRLHGLVASRLRQAKTQLG